MWKRSASEGLFAAPTHATVADGESEIGMHTREEVPAGGAYQPLPQDDDQDLPSSGRPLDPLAVVRISVAEEGQDGTEVCPRERRCVLMERDTREVVSLQEGPLESQCLQQKKNK